MRREHERRELRSGAPPEQWWQALVTYLGFPVEEDAPTPAIKPWATWLVALGCILFTGYAFLAADPEQFIGEYGLLPGDSWRHGGLTLITSFFLHGGLLHLLGNLWFLMLVGDNVEDILGRGRFLLLLAASSLLGDVWHWAMDPGSMVPVVGASGGISGLMAYYALRLPKVRLALCFRVFFYPVWFRLRVATAMILWVILQLFISAQQLGGTGSVSGLAHLGGAMAGVLFWAAQRVGHSGERDRGVPPRRREEGPRRPSRKRRRRDGRSEEIADLWGPDRGR